jgi:hypothetical protein
MKQIYMILVSCFLGNILFSQDGNIPTNLQIDAASVGGVSLSWDVPASFRRNWVTHSNLNYQGGIGAPPVEHFVCQKFPDSLLSDYHGMLLKELAFVPSLDTDNASYQPLVFETDPDSPIDSIPDIWGRSNLVLSAPSRSIGDGNTVQGAWNTMELKDHVPGYSLENDIDPSTHLVDSTKTLWFGYWLYDYVLYPSGADVGPANEGLGNVIIWCPTSGCYESTLTESAAEGLTLNFDWLMAISLIYVDSTAGLRERSITLSNNETNYNVNSGSVSISHSINNQFIMESGPIRNIILEPLDDISRDVSNYFIFENDQVADVVQPTYLDFNTTNREQTILGEREPGYYEFYVKAQTADGLSDPSNTVSIDIQNNVPSPFSLIAPEDGSLVSVTQSTISNTISFIWTNSVDTDGQELYFTFDICTASGDLVCHDTTMTERLYQTTNQIIIDSLDLASGDNFLSWSVFVTDGMDTVFSVDTIRYLTLSLDQLGTEFPKIQPERFILNQNYPNPFNPVTMVSYKLAEPEFVNLSVYDVNGNFIKNLISGKRGSGENIVNWNGKNDANENVAGGVYFYRIETESYSSTKKMILLK